MKRTAALRQLSREHHTALALSLRIARSTDAPGMELLLVDLPTIFEHELEPHFRAEESALLPVLQAAGELALVARTEAEHRLLRELAARIARGERECLASFGEALKAHVRFEERELFIAAEAVLSEGKS